MAGEDLKQLAASSEEIAVEALGRLRNGGSFKLNGVSGAPEGGSNKSERLLDKMKQSAVELYEQTRTNHPKLIRRADQLVKKIEKTSGRWRLSGKRKLEDASDDEDQHNNQDEAEVLSSHGLDIDQITVQGSDAANMHRARGSKRRRIKENLKEYQLNMSIESKKRLITCLGLLKLANKQLSQRVMSLQDVVKKEQIRRHSPKPLKSSHPVLTSEEKSSSSTVTHEKVSTTEEDDEEQFYDASSNLQSVLADKKQPESTQVDDFIGAEENLEIDPMANAIQLEVVGTLKKIYTVVSKFTGNSLPEPARSQVRESLLKLPTKWMINLEKPNSKKVSSNKRALLLAQEALDMVGNVMNVVDSTLGKAEEWVKNKQELKQMLMEQFKHEQLKQQVKHALTKDSNSSTPSKS